MPADAPDTSAFVSPDVVAQALEPALAPDERVIEAAFVVSLEGRGMATAAPVRDAGFRDRSTHRQGRGLGEERDLGGNDRGRP